jgi:hypothetical protein
VTLNSHQTSHASGHTSCPVVVVTVFLLHAISNSVTHKSITVDTRIHGGNTAIEYHLRRVSIGRFYKSWTDYNNKVETQKITRDRRYDWPSQCLPRHLGVYRKRWRLWFAWGRAEVERETTTFFFCLNNQNDSLAWDNTLPDGTDDQC